MNLVERTLVVSAQQVKTQNVSARVPATAAGSMVPRHLYFLLLGMVLLAMFWVPLSTWLSFAFRYEHCSHILLIPWVSLALVYFERRRIFASVHFGLGAGAVLFVLGMVVYGLGRKYSLLLTPIDDLFVSIFSLVLLVMASFVSCYGTQAFRVGAFPLSFLFLAVPIPDFLLEKTIYLLQVGSSEAANALYKLAGVPVLRQGFVFSLPGGLKIEIAKQCSGIRSSLALFVASLLAGHLFLRSAWRKACLTLAIFPVIVLKNGLRVVVLSLLAVYVDRNILGSDLHRYGGIPVFILGLALLAPILGALYRWENKAEERKPTSGLASST